MTRLSVLSMVVIAAVTLSSAGVADDRQEHAGNLRRKAAELVRQGRPDEARRLELEISKLLQGADGRKSAGRRTDAETEQLEEHLRDLRAKAELLQDSDAPARKQAELKEQIARIERELDERRAGAKKRNLQKSRAEKLAPSPLKKKAVVPEKKAAGFDSEIRAAQERLKHVLAAAEHLDAAGMKELAHELRQHAEQMEREIRQSIEQHEKPDGRSGEIGELRNEVRRLREELQELREKVNRE